MSSSESFNVPLCGESLVSFSALLASSAPVPGGGGAAALCGALSAALGQMVGNLTVGKPKYKDAEAQVCAILQQLDVSRTKLLGFVEADAVAFEPLSKAYALPKDDPQRPAVMEEALRGACAVPLAIMEEVSTMLPALRSLFEVGSRLAVSDVGVAATCAACALQGAVLNIAINTRSMADRTEAQRINAQANDLLAYANDFLILYEQVRLHLLAD